MRLQLAQKLIEVRQREQTIQAYLFWWKSQLAQKVNWKYKAIPFHQAVIEYRYKQTVVAMLKEHKDKKQNEKLIFKKAFEFYRYQLLLKSTEILKEHQQQKKDQNSKIEFLTLKRVKRTKREFVRALALKVEKRNKYKEAYDFIR